MGRLAVGTLAWLLLGGAAWGSQGSVQEALERADQAMASNDYAAADILYQKALGLARGASYEALLGRSGVQLLYGDYDLSLDLARRAFAQAADPVQMVHSLDRAGAILLEMADATTPPNGSNEPAPERGELLAEAETTLRQALQISQERSSRTWYYLAEVLFAGDRAAEASAAIERHLELTPERFRTDRALSLRSCLAALSEARSTVLGEDAELVQPPLKISGDPPIYTWSARSSLVQGQVTVEALVTREGDVPCTRIVRGLPKGLSRAAADAVRTWKFEPALVLGQPVPVRYHVTIDFTASLDNGR
jgi:TonB family protein